MELEVRHLRLVVAVAHQGSIGAAAASLGLPQPAVSAQLRRIETLLGGPLFVRRRSGTEPTELGHLVLDQAPLILESMAELMTARDRLLAQARKSFRIAGNASAPFARFLPAAMQAFPGRITSRSDVSTRNLDDWLHRGDVDLISAGVHRGYDDVVDTEGIEQASYVESEPFLVALAADNPLARAADLSLEDLRDEAWLLPPGRPDATMRSFRDAFAEAGLEPKAPHGPLDLAHHERLVSDGHAVVLAVPTYVPGPGIAVVPLRHRLLQGRLVVRWRTERIPQPDVDDLRCLLAVAYVDQLLEAALAQPWWRSAPSYRPVIAADLLHHVDPRLLSA